jgi:hypothetical protein
MNNNEEKFDPSYVDDRKQGDEEHGYRVLDPNGIVEDNNAGSDNNERRNTLRISSSLRKYCRDSYHELVNGHASITTGIGENIPTFNQAVIASVDMVRNWCRHGFINLDAKFQCWLANAKPGQNCVLWDLEAVMNKLGLTSPDQIDSFSPTAIIDSGVLPLIKTPTKAFGSWSLLSRFGGAANIISHINMGTPTRLRCNTAVGFVIDPSWGPPFDDYGTVPLDPDGDDRLEELKREAEARLNAVKETFLIHDASDETLLKIVKGTKKLFDAVGCKERFGDDFTTDSVRKAIEEAGGRLFHRESAKGVDAFFISVAEEDSPTVTSAEAEQRFQEIKCLVDAYDGGGDKPSEFFTFSIYRERNGEIVASGCGKNNLIKAMNEVTNIDRTSNKYTRWWSVAPGGEKIKEAIKESMWRANARDGWLFNKKAELWVKLDYDEEEVVVEE